MDDIKKIAEERAKRETTPLGASLETEKQIQKKALVQQIQSLDGSNVKKIAANLDTSQDTDKKLRVAAYCRVSTDDIDQKVSITLQIDEYRNKIKKNPDWKYVGTYVDDGFSGTNTEHRQGFQKLMKDALDGKIDMIITKAVSRFARNLLDCIGWVETLQNHDPPIRVFFEQENLDTAAQTSGIILFVLAMVAEEESHMKSEAMLLSLEWRFSRGRFMTPRLFGYDKIEVPDGFGGKKKVLSVNENEARVIKWMYSTLLNGGTTEEIAEVLTELRIPTGGRCKKDGTPNTNWSSSGVLNIMRNERYCGDVLARKTYTPNFKDHKAKKNNGKKNKYFQPDHHEAIVTRTMWNAAQRILNSRKYKHKGIYLPMHIITNGTLTGFISMNRAWAGFDADDYYRASQIAMGILDEDQTDIEEEYLPESGHKLGGLMDDQGITQIARDLTAAEQEIKNQLDGITNDEQEQQSKEEIVKTFQVVSGDMFSRISEPVLRIGKNNILFNKSCTSKLAADFVEILFNPVERMLVVRKCDENNPNVVKWDGKGFSATSLCKILYDSLNWDTEYSYRIPCQIVNSNVIAFDLDNFIGRAVNKKEEIILAKKTAEALADENEEAKSYFYPPDEDEEPQEIHDIEERFQRAKEINKKIFGTPVFAHTSLFREIDNSSDNDWLTPATALDISHTIQDDVVENLLEGIMDNPPELPKLPTIQPVEVE